MITKQCEQCGKPFKKSHSMGNPYWEQRKLCGRDCQSEWMKGFHNSPATEFPKGGVENQITCKVCKKSFTAFATNAKYCTHDCYLIARKELASGRNRDPIKIREFNLRRSFGITIEQYDKMMATQKNKCAICRKHQSEESRRFAVDHDHNTGEIRGLLCLNCNRGLGAFMDSDEMLVEALAYLRQAMRRAGKL